MYELQVVDSTFDTRKIGFTIIYYFGQFSMPITYSAVFSE